LLKEFYLLRRDIYWRVKGEEKKQGVRKRGGGGYEIGGEIRKGEKGKD